MSEPIELGGVTARVCRVKGDVEGTRVECLGTVAETREAPEWDELDVAADATDSTGIFRRNVSPIAKGQKANSVVISRQGSK